MKTEQKEALLPLTKGIIAFQNGMAIIPVSEEKNDRLAASLQAELMALGFMFDKAAYQAACSAPHNWIVSFHNRILPWLKENMGCSRDYRPFYRNFPTQVMEMDYGDLFLNAITHYWSDGTWEPPQRLKDRGFAFENVKFKTVRIGKESEFKAIFTRLASINQSLTPNDKATLKWFIDNCYEDLILPESIPFKETLCILAARNLDVPVHSPTDVLRVAVYLSGGDISLPNVPKVSTKGIETGMFTSQYRSYFLRNVLDSQRQAREAFKFKKFKRSERRMLLALLEKTNLDLGDMQARLGRWLRLGEILHVGEYAARFPKTAKAFFALRNQTKENRIRTFHGRVDLAFEKSWKKGMEVLAERPGEFARKLDWMLREFEAKPVLAKFREIGSKVSSKVQFELWQHFDQRTKPNVPRNVMIKGKNSKMEVLEPLPPMDANLVQRVKNCIMDVLGDRISILPKLGRVWIDPRLKDVPVPFSMRSLNPSIKTYVRGTRIPFKADAKFVRPFIHWYDEDGSIDLDLSVGLCSEEFEYKSHISFTNLHDREFGCCHSGDIRHRRGACAEYVDIDIRRCLHGGIRYAVIQAHNYDQRPMHEVKDAVFGLMERENAVANEIFVPKTISNCMRLANESPSVSVCILDLKEHCFIWADIEAASGFATMEHTWGSVQDVMKSLTRPPKLSVYDLLKMHADGRGSLATSENASDVKFAWQDFVADYAKVAEFMRI